MYKPGDRIIIEDGKGVPSSITPVRKMYKVADMCPTTHQYTATITHDSKNRDGYKVLITTVSGSTNEISVYPSEIIGLAVYDRDAISRDLIQMYTQK